MLFWQANPENMPNISIIAACIIILSIKVYSQPYPVGSATINYIDPDRNNRVVSTAIYYPGTSAGQNVPVAQGTFPVIVFGHGFVMVHTAYQYLWLHYVPKGYILAFPTTEGSFSPSHLNFGLDLAFLVSKLKAEGTNPASLFYGHIGETSAVMGHSMGGGASFLACANNTLPTTMVTFAAANTSPSAIQAAGQVSIPTLLLAGGLDCVTPPALHQYPMYEATASDKKIIIDILGGGHCFFADYNFYCSVGEASCSPQPTITRLQQQDVVLDFLDMYFDYMLKGNSASWSTFLDSLQASARITYTMQWTNVGIPGSLSTPYIKVYPNPFRTSFNVQCEEGLTITRVVVYNSMSQKILELGSDMKSTVEIAAKNWGSGHYILEIITNQGIVRRNIFKR